MAKDNNKSVQIPGTLGERVQAFVWYGVVISLWLGLVSFFNEFFHKIKKFDYDALPKKTGQTAVLTGGTRGIGFEVLAKLLRLDYRVIMGVRNPEAGHKAVNSIRKSGIISGTVLCFRLDLKSLKSVRRFAEDLLKETDRIDLLINNAGIMFEPYELTEDGFEIQFQVNYLSHYLLTNLLLPKLKSTGARKNTHCRIVNVSSVAHIGSSARNIEDVPNPRIHSAFRAYFDSKLCQILLTKFQNAQLTSEGANVSVYALHPGVIVTDLYLSLGVVRKFVNLFRTLYRSSEEGAEIIMYAAISPEIENEGGLYILNSRKTNPSSAAESIALQKLLWDISEDCVNQKRLK